MRDKNARKDPPATDRRNGGGAGSSMSAGVLGRLGRRACDAAEPLPVILTRALRSMKSWDGKRPGENNDDITFDLEIVDEVSQATQATRGAR
ncbi:hypothetical protein C6P46_004609 [Rhodotorula mucilaginosa]|uniref:Uncharacterized protein n=1 Tax=Rhodotorula mucilaginosa TaxID=5537 RepID=A0A9P6W2J7_RHOMI|nr:hypothetical protein C6P46_004609 [Rhodotorula mucilaginosa]